MSPGESPQADALGAERIRRILDARTAALAAAAPARRGDRPMAWCWPARWAARPMASRSMPWRRCCLPARPFPCQGAAPPVLGAIGLAGRIWTVLDLRAALGLPPPSGNGPGQGAGPGHLLRLRHAQRRLALRVDRALSVTPVFAAPGGEPAPEVARRGVTGYAVAPPGSVAAQEALIGLLDLDALLDPILLPPSAVGA